MGAERANTARRRELGLICCYCSSDIPLQPMEQRVRGERMCGDCLRRRAFRCGRPYEVVMWFMLRDGWSAVFMAPDCKTVLSRYFNIGSLDQLRAFVARTEPSADTLAEFEASVRAWSRGAIHLYLTAKQFLLIVRR